MLKSDKFTDATSETIRTHSQTMSQVKTPGKHECTSMKGAYLGIRFGHPRCNGSYRGRPIEENREL